MKTKQKFLSVVLTLSVMLTLVPTVVFAIQTDSCPNDASCQHEAAIGSIHFDTLSEAISVANGQEIKLLRSIEVNEPIVITSNTIIDGANGNGVFKISPSSTASTNERRKGLFLMNNESDTPATLTLKNIELVNKNQNNSWPDACGISVRASNQSINLDNVSIDTSHYCIFVGVPGSENEYIDDVNININNSNLTGYAAIYYRTNSTTHMIKRPILKVTNSELTGRGYDGFSNGFATIVFNGTRDAKANISNSILSNSFDSTNANADEGIIMFNSWGAFEERAEITIHNSTIKTKSTTAAPNVIKYTAGENLNVGNKVIVDHLTLMVDENESDLIRVMRNTNELVATGKELNKVLSLQVPGYGDKPGGSTSTDPANLIMGGDTVVVPINTTLTADAMIPENVTVHIKEGAKLTIADGVKLRGSTGAKLVVQGTIDGLNNINASATYTWRNNSWVIDVDSVTLDKNAIALLKEDTAQLVATVKPDNADNTSVTWESDAPNIATVDATGKVTAIAPGTATITAKAQDKTATCTVTVYKVEAPTTPTIDTTEPVKEVTVGVNDKASQEAISEAASSIVEDILLGKDVSKVDSQTVAAVKDAVQNGKEITIEVKVEKIDASQIDENEKGTIIKFIREEKIGNETVTIVEYLDLSIILKADGRELGTVNELGKEVAFTLAIPEDLVKEGRTFYVVRVHEGIAEKLPVTLNEDGTITFKTDKFSTYALAYVDAGKVNGVDTKDTTNVAGLIALMGLTVIVIGRKAYTLKK